MKPFSIFSETNNTFEGMEREEKVLLLIRRHPFFIIIKLLTLIFLLILPMMIGYIFSDFLILYKLLGLSVFIYGIWWLVIWQVMFYSITMYALDVWIVTDRRIIDSTQHGFFNRSVAELHLTRVQDVSVEVVGFMQTFLDFGNMEVQTAGTENKFQFSQIPHPNEVKRQIMNHISSSLMHLPPPIL